MRHVLLVCVLAAAARSSGACSLGDDSVDPPAQDLGVVAGRSPPAPEVADAIVEIVGHEPGCGEAPKCGDATLDLLSLQVTATAGLDRFRIDFAGGETVYAQAGRLDAGDAMAIAIFAENRRPPFTIAVSAYDADGYRSEATTVRVEDLVDHRTGGGCAVGGGAPAWWVLAVAVLRGRRRFRW